MKIHQKFLDVKNNICLVLIYFRENFIGNKSSLKNICNNTYNAYNEKKGYNNFSPIII